ncbi:coagulation factor XI-like, partial [Ruditapes philippinarum]|uniref:coagulation factor XI-like n=1 Tax=Ruditapes philippinarum TaxID=129788 RepID=UPI00295B6AF4
IAAVKRSYAINDIALLKLKSYIVFNDYIQPACLPESSDLSEIKCEVSGWGYKKEKGSITDTLRAAQVPIIQEHKCRTLLKNYSIDFGKVICAGDGSADACTGDSGGSLICEINGIRTVIGITSWGLGCGRKDSPGVYTKVSKYLRWIDHQISNDSFAEAATDDPCTGSPCKNGGTCTSQSGSYTCSCTSQFAGTNCDQSCPSAWNLSSGRCYIFKHAALNWSTAKRKCSLEGGTLAQVDSEVVNNFLNTLRSNTGHSTVRSLDRIG